MKRLIISISILFCIVAASCKKVPGPADGNSVQLNNNLDSTVSISATINGSKWQTDSAFGYIITPSGNDSLVEGIFISATRTLSSGSATMTFNLTNYTGPGTYTITPPINEVLYYVGTARHLALSGEVVVISDSAYALKGVFNFVADSFTVTNGVFNVASP